MSRYVPVEIWVSFHRLISVQSKVVTASWDGLIKLWVSVNSNVSSVDTYRRFVFNFLRIKTNIVLM